MAETKKKAEKPKKSSEGTPEVDRDVRVDELWKFTNAMIGANAKRTYDEYQNESLRGLRKIDKQIDDMHTVRLQILSNMAENANLATKQFLTNNDFITKQCVRHNDIAIDCTWDPGPGEESLKDTKK